MSEPRHPVESSLRGHTENLEFGPPPIDTIVAGGSRRRRRRAASLATGAVAAVALVGGLGWAAAPLLGGGTSDAPVAGTPSTGPKAPTTTGQSQPNPSATSQSAWPPQGVTLTPCADLPPIADPGAIDDFTVDVENGILSFGFPTAQGHRTVDIAYLRDEHCRDRPDVRQLVERVEDASPN